MPKGFEGQVLIVTLKNALLFYAATRFIYIFFYWFM